MASTRPSPSASATTVLLVPKSTPIETARGALDMSCSDCDVKGGGRLAVLAGLANPSARCKVHDLPHRSRESARCGVRNSQPSSDRTPMHVDSRRVRRGGPLGGPPGRWDDPDSIRADCEGELSRPNVQGQFVK